MYYVHFIQLIVWDKVQRPKDEYHSIYGNLWSTSSIVLKRHYFVEINRAVQNCPNSEFVLECLSKANLKIFDPEIELGSS